MFLVEDRNSGVVFLVFTWEDPRKDGYTGPVVEGVSLDYDPAVHAWPDGAARPEGCVGRDPENPKRYKVFKYSEDVKKASYQTVPGTAVVVRRWFDYLPPEITVPVSRLGEVERLLERHHIPYWVDENVLSWNGEPEEAFVRLGRGVDLETVRAILDTVR